jgi:predicted SnoaL-like aldol condensation-catalyzing enzyme
MTPIRMEKIESASRIVMSFIEAFNHHDISAMLQFISEDCLFETASPAPDGEKITGKPAIAQYFQESFTRFPQAQLHAEELLGYGIRCFLRWRVDWIDPTGESTHLRGMDLFRVQQDMICEKYSYIKA